jgi:hypothetical protein
LPGKFTLLAGYHRKSAAKLLNRKPVKETIIPAGKQAAKPKPEKKRPASRKRKGTATRNRFHRCRPRLDPPPIFTFPRGLGKRLIIFAFLFPGYFHLFIEAVPKLKFWNSLYYIRFR